MLTRAKKDLKKSLRKASKLCAQLCPRAGGCGCHNRGLNSWIKYCPVCGCINPKYTGDNK